MRIKKRPSLSKINRDSNQKQKLMSMTMTSTVFSSRQLKDSKLPPLRPAFRKTSTKFGFPKNSQQKYHKQTEATAMEQNMLQSYYQTVDKGWIKPSQYLKDIKQANLIAEESLNMQSYEIKLNQNMQKNIGKLDMLFALVQRWNSILRKILQYTVSKKNNTPYLIEEVKFWRALSKKFDELQYEFNNEKIQRLLTLMKNSIKIRAQFKASFEEFTKLKDSVIEKTPLLRKLYLSLEQSVSGNIQGFTQSSDILISTGLLKKTLLAFEMIAENNEMVRPRMEIVYDKMNDAMIQKLSAASLYPRHLANISFISQKYAILDKALSFYSNFISVMEQSGDQQIMLILEKAQYTRNVLVNLLQIMGYFEFLYRKKQVLEFSKLFSVQLEENIFCHESKEEWGNYMAKVEQSISSKDYPL